MNLSKLLENRESVKKLAMILLTIGVLLPSITYPLSKLTTNGMLKQVLFAQNGVKYSPSFDEYELVVYKGTWVKVVYEDTWVKEVYKKGHHEYRFTIPFNYIVVVSILLLASGSFLFYRFKQSST